MTSVIATVHDWLFDHTVQFHCNPAPTTAEYIHLMQIWYMNNQFASNSGPRSWHSNLQSQLAVPSEQRLWRKHLWAVLHNQPFQRRSFETERSASTATFSVFVPCPHRRLFAATFVFLLWRTDHMCLVWCSTDHRRPSFSSSPVHNAVFCPPLLPRCLLSRICSPGQIWLRRHIVCALSPPASSPPNLLITVVHDLTWSLCTVQCLLAAPSYSTSYPAVFFPTK